MPDRSIVRLFPASPLASAHRTVEAVRMIEALLFASAEPLGAEELARRLPTGTDVEEALAHLAETYAGRGVTLTKVAGRWTFRTAPDLAFLIAGGLVEERRLSRAALETLAIIAYHQPVTRADIEGIRGVSISRGTLDVLLQNGWVKPRGRRRAPGRPVTYGVTDAFLVHFGLDSLADLPGLDELRAAGLLDGHVGVERLAGPRPAEGLTEEEDPLDPAEPEGQMQGE